MALSGRDESALEASGLQDPVINHGGINREFNAEMEEFAKMEEGIKDIDYYKAETDAARNGQTAAMEFAEAKTAEATAWRAKWNSTNDLLTEKEDMIENLRVGIIVLFVFAFILGCLIGGSIF